MHEGLKPCQFRQVDNHGRILCGLIKGGDREVSVNLCRACPVPQINCQHLRATLTKNAPTPLTVRYATGRVEVWDNEPPAVEFRHAACAEKTMPIHSPRDCAGCPIRLPNVIPQNAIQVAHHARQNPPATRAAAAMEQVAVAPRAKPTPRPQPSGLPLAPGVPAAATASAAVDLVARARATASRKAQERAAAVHEEREPYSAEPEPPEAAPTNKSKIILLQQWLADQLDRKQTKAKSAPAPDAQGVSEITYAPVAPAYREDSGYERCVGWTD